MSWGAPQPLQTGAPISYEAVAAKYTELSRQAAFNGKATEQADYPPDLRALVPEAIFGTSCGGGNPFVLGRPAPGDSVADLGCGAGLDLCIAAALVGQHGRVLGVDLNSAMLSRAREGVRLSAVPGKDLAEVVLVEAPFDDPSHEALGQHWGRYDLVTSNGALCLSFGKERALATAFRLLRPGGRLQLFDLCRVDGTVPGSLGRRTQESWYSEELPPRATVESWANWVSGCELPAELAGRLRRAGFEAVEMRGWTAFMTSPETRGALFSAVRPPCAGAPRAGAGAGTRRFLNGRPASEAEWSAHRL